MMGEAFAFRGGRQDVDPFFSFPLKSVANFGTFRLLAQKFDYIVHQDAREGCSKSGKRVLM